MKLRVLHTLVVDQNAQAGSDVTNPEFVRLAHDHGVVTGNSQVVGDNIIVAGSADASRRAGQLEYDPLTGGV